MATSRRGDCDGDNRVLPADKQQEPPGLWGPDGLLAVTHVKMILSLVCVIQVRWRTFLRDGGSTLFSQAANVWGWQAL